MKVMKRNLREIISMEDHNIKTQKLLNLKDLTVLRQPWEEDAAVKEMKKKHNLKNLSFASLAIHGDVAVEQIPDHAPPIRVATTFSLESQDEFIYSRADQPARVRLEHTLGYLDSGYAVSYSSGLAAISNVIEMLKPEMLCLVNCGYTGSLSYFKEFKTCDSEGLKEVEKDKKKVIFCESVRNPGTCNSPLIVQTFTKDHLSSRFKSC